MILVIETAAEICSVALASTSGECVGHLRAETRNSHAEKLPVIANTLLQDHKLKAHELLAVAVNKGPGSYTGLRIGTSLAKGICFAANIPLIAANGFLAMALDAKENGHSGDIFLANLDARRDEFYLQCFDSELNVLKNVEARIADSNFLRSFDQTNVVVCGNSNEKIKQLSDAREGCLFYDTSPNAAWMCKEVGLRWNQREFEDVAYFEPHYLKDFIPGISKKASI